MPLGAGLEFIYFSAKFVCKKDLGISNEYSIVRVFVGMSIYSRMPFFSTLPSILFLLRFVTWLERLNNLQTLHKAHTGFQPTLIAAIFDTG